MLVSITVRYSNKELVSIAVGIDDAKEDLVVGPVRQLLPRLPETPCLFLRLQHRRRSVDDLRRFELCGGTGDGVLNTGRGNDEAALSADQGPCKTRSTIRRALSHNRLHSVELHKLRAKADIRSHPIQESISGQSSQAGLEHFCRRFR
jgi:hypothetical protein